jgi:LPS sulfotransferase NodH
MKNNYILCTTQRSGKTWICSTLKCLGVGAPEEYLHALHDRNLQSDFAIKIRGAFDSGGVRSFVSLISEMQGGGIGNVGLAIQWNQLANLAAVAKLSDEEAFGELRGAMNDAIVFFIVREDLIGQAISHYLMQQSGYAHSSSASDRKSLRVQVEYRSEEILRFMEFALVAYRSWLRLFEGVGVNFIPISYESLVDDPKGGFCKIIRTICPEWSVSEDRIVSCSHSLSVTRDEVDIKMRQSLLTDSKCCDKAKQLVSELQTFLHKLNKSNK